MLVGENKSDGNICLLVGSSEGFDLVEVEWIGVLLGGRELLGIRERCLGTFKGGWNLRGRVACSSSSLEIAIGIGDDANSSSEPPDSPTEPS